MFLSIIIPVYNTEKYLAECLDSCLAQDIPYSDYEIICINDGSTDGSAAILADYSANNDNIIVITQKNKGLSAARNVGIESARGEYIWFIDSDDFIQTNILALLKDKTLDSHCDRLTFRFFEFENVLSPEQIELKQSHEDIPNSHMGYSGIWSGIFNNATIKQQNIRFPELTHVEDIVFLAYFIDINPKIEYLEHLVYFYRRNPASITRTTELPENRIKYLKSHIDGAVILDDLYKHNDVNRTSKSFWLMHFLQCIMIKLSQMPRKEASKYLQQLKDKRLFPHSVPVKYTLQSTGHTTRKDIVGRMYNYIISHSCTPLGYNLLRLYERIHTIWEICKKKT